jgi:hypothetical protein
MKYIILLIALIQILSLNMTIFDIKSSYKKGTQKADIYIFLNAAENIENNISYYNQKNINLTTFNNNLPEILNKLSKNNDFNQEKTIEMLDYYSEYNISMENDYYKYLNFPINDKEYCKLINEFENKNLTCNEKDGDLTLKYKLFQEALS